MKIPESPPPFALHDLPLDGDRGAQFLAAARDPAPAGRYRHWDTLRRLSPPPGLTLEEWWAALKLGRAALLRPLPLKDAHGRPFQIALPDPALVLLHLVDRRA